MDLHRWLVWGSWIFGALGLLGIMPAMMSPMLFDAPGSTKQLATKVLFVCAASFPVVCLLALLAGWYVFKRVDQTSGVLIAYTPLLSVVIFVGTLLYIGVARNGDLGS